MPGAILLRDLEGLEEARAAEDLQREVWGMDDLDITPTHHLVAARKTGGQLIGAFEGETLVGFVYGFVGLERGEAIHHSHLLAVQPAFRNHEIAYRLKLAQREAVLAQGLRRITWTFDPLQSANAHLNFHKLAATSASYHTDFYGATSSFLHRNGTDRLWVSWDLDRPRVLSRLAGEEPEAPPHGTPALLRAAADGSPEELDLGPGLAADRALLEIPAEINACFRDRPDRASRWRALTRRAFCAAFEAGFLVEDFRRPARGGRPVGTYVLRRAGSGEGGA